MQQLLLDSRVGTERQGKVALGLCEAPSALDQFAAHRVESLEFPKRRALRRGGSTPCLGDHLQLAIEVVRENGGKQEDLVTGQCPGGDVVELSLRLQLCEDAFLGSSAIVEIDDRSSVALLIGQHHLELVAVDLWHK